jgi:hypothetical protein
VSGCDYRWRVAYSHWDRARGVERRSHMDGAERPDVGQVRLVIMTGTSGLCQKTPSEGVMALFVRGIINRAFGQPWASC